MDVSGRGRASLSVAIETGGTLIAIIMVAVSYLLSLVNNCGGDISVRINQRPLCYTNVN